MIVTGQTEGTMLCFGLSPCWILSLRFQYDENKTKIKILHYLFTTRIIWCSNVLIFMAIDLAENSRYSLSSHNQLEGIAYNSPSPTSGDPEATQRCAPCSTSHN